MLKFPVATFFCCVFIIVAGDANAQQVQPVQFQAGQTVTILSTADLQNDGLLFPDMPLGFARISNGQYMGIRGRR